MQKKKQRNRSTTCILMVYLRRFDYVALDLCTVKYSRPVKSCARVQSRSRCLCMSYSSLGQFPPPPRQMPTGNTHTHTHPPANSTGTIAPLDINPPRTINPWTTAPGQLPGLGQQPPRMIAPRQSPLGNYPLRTIAPGQLAPADNCPPPRTTHPGQFPPPGFIPSYAYKEISLFLFPKRLFLLTI